MLEEVQAVDKGDILVSRVRRVAKQLEAALASLAR